MGLSLSVDCDNCGANSSERQDLGTTCFNAPNRSRLGNRLRANGWNLVSYQIGTLTMEKVYVYCPNCKECAHGKYTREV